MMLFSCDATCWRESTLLRDELTVFRHELVEGLIMSTLVQEKPSTSSPKARQRSHRGTSDKARGQRDASIRRSQSEAREATSPVATSQPKATEEGMKLPTARTTRRRSSLGVFIASISLTKCFTLFGFTVAAVHIILFGLDLAIAWPLQRASILFDINCVVCGILLSCLSWGTFRDQVREAR